MAFEHYIFSGGKKLRCGYTTGSCAALAAKAAAEMLLGGKPVETIAITTPKGLRVEVSVTDILIAPQCVSCAVRKDGGDDIDATDGALIYAAVSRIEAVSRIAGAARCDTGIHIDGGTGVGRVTRKGLDQPVGAAAINSVPRRMIEEEVRKVCEKYGCDGGLSVTISVPDGEKIAEKTYNGHLGILGGISILGTTGIVEPQSVAALVDSIGVEIRMISEEYGKELMITPGNYGEQFIQGFGDNIKRPPYVKCSNYIGEALDFAAVYGFETVLVAGHIGKLVKLAGGIMNTHSRYADCRMELFAAHAAACGADRETVERLLDAATCDACIEILDAVVLREAVMRRIFERMQEHLERRAGGAYRVGTLAFSNEYGLLGMSIEGERMMKQWGKK